MKTERNYLQNLFKIRCSGIGHIMTEPRGKADKDAGLISETTKTYCQNWLKSKIFNRRLEFTSKYTEKGIIMEDDAIDFASKMLDVGLLFKDEQVLENDYMTGHMDISLPNWVYDIKNSWSWETFPLFETEIPNILYYWQLQGYMALTGKEYAKLVYVLSDTPKHIIERGARNYCFYNGYGELDMDIYNQFYEKLTYKDIPDELKIKVFYIERNESDISRIENQVLKCRNYIDSLILSL